MKREIKFRGMSLNGEWHYGNLAILTKKVGPSEAGSYISNSVGLPFAYDVRPETVGQFCGLHDKNGKEIYEGDIISYRTEPVVVEYHTDMFHCRSTKYPNLSPGNYRLATLREVCEIIGNIYENPELIGGVS